MNGLIISVNNIKSQVRFKIPGNKSAEKKNT